MKNFRVRTLAMLVGVVSLVTAGLLACGSDKKDDNDSTDKKLSFETDVNPIIKASCAKAGLCHGVGSTESTVYVDKEDNFKKSSAATRMGLPSTNLQSMPKPDGGLTISAENKQILLDFLAQ